ncbi:MAG: hypothetical protein COA94_03920 [Rickettsiales bacterium]|nr:MAG: hypothetical protein COA94_03920 [Rickettsiales bacterium]
MKKLLALLQTVILLFLIPGVPIARWCKVEEDKMLFRMTINIIYYLTIAVFALIENISDL